MNVSVIILAAGQGKRMHSARPKVLQPLAGRPLLRHVVDCARATGAADVCVVYGHGGDAVREAFAADGLRWALQAEQLGTGHAVMQAMPDTPDDHRVLILAGDVPLLRPATLSRLLEAGDRDSLVLLTVDMPEPHGYGRIVRAGGQVVRIVEEKDANDDERRLNEINTGVMSCPAARLKAWLSRLDNSNSQGEYYLTDIIEMAVQDGVPVHGVKAAGADEVMGINNRRQLAAAERALQKQRVDALMDSGVSFADPARVDIRGTLSCGEDVFIDVNAVFEGDVRLGDRVTVAANNVIRDSAIGDDSIVHPHCHIEGAETAERCVIGPFARLRPGAALAAGVRVGNFVEIKKSRIAAGSKVNHLSYIGDTIMGSNVNIGAGTITCNYDGANKHQTRIGDDAFIGSGVQLVAPVDVGKGATIGAGSTISKTAPADSLTLARARQATIDGWKRPQKKS